MALIINHHNLRVPKGATPLSNEAREFVFSSVGDTRLSKSRVLDLFAGSGSNGIEALSRGASKCIFVDHTIDAKDCITYNLKQLRLMDKALIFADTVDNFLKRNSMKFDLIMIDPPLPKLAYKSLDPIYRILNPEGLVVYRHVGNSNIPYASGMEIIDKRTIPQQGQVIFFIKRS